jgi:hypothetical protein
LEEEAKMGLFSNTATVYNPSPSNVLAPLPDPRTIHTLKFQNQELFRVKASKPFNFFTEELIVQEKTISIVKKEFLSNCCETLPIKDIGRVILTDTIFFSSILVIGKNTAHQLEITRLPKQKALEAKELLEGLMMEDASAAMEIPPYLQPDVHPEVIDSPIPDHDHLLDPVKLLGKYSQNWS